MTRYVALLRGVNVGGVTVKMAELAELMRGLGYSGVRTVLASGNALFESDEDAATARGRLEAALRERFGYEAWVHVLTVERIRAIVDAYPFERGREGWHDFATFTLTPEARAELLEVRPDDHERTAGGEGVVYWTRDVRLPRSIDSAVSKAHSAGRLKVWLTTRNLNTLDRLLR